MDRRRILIVDDELEAPRLLKRLLERRHPYEVMLEHDSMRALVTANAFKPDLILLDIIMPGLDGGDLARQLRASQELEKVPIIFISAVAEPIAGYPFLSKPAGIDRIVASIEEQFESGLE